MVDDIADSFDYQNKYAIVQYLQEIESTGHCKLIIMTHNFDFFRILESRFVSYESCLMASKNQNGITLAKATGIRNIFAKDWKLNFFTDARKKIASIPFLRNLVEMTTGEADPKYIQLTSMIHWKTDTPTLTVAQLDSTYNSICATAGASPDQSKLICDLIVEQANASLPGGSGLNLENKIVLAIGTRLLAEKFIISKISDPQFVSSITRNQTGALIRRFKKQFPGDIATAKTLDMVALMTPENIHVNAFMYEPIVDMSDDHLRRLFSAVSDLK